MFPTGEHRFHHAKFTLVAKTYEEGSPRRQELLKYALRFSTGAEAAFGTDGASAKRAGGKRGLPLTLEELCRYNSSELQGRMVDVQRSIVEQKAVHESVQAALAEVDKGARLLHFERGSVARKPSFWGGFVHPGRGTVYGENMLGQLWDAERDLSK